MARKFNLKEMKAYNEAFDAFETGVFVENPYRKGTKQHNAWAEGFGEALDTHSAAQKREADAAQEFHG